MHATSKNGNNECKKLLGENGYEKQIEQME